MKNIIILLTILSSIPILIVLAIAYEIIYDFNGTKLLNNPKVCAIEPEDPNLTEKQIELLMKESKSTISEWENKLKRTESKNTGIWEIDYVEINKKMIK